MGKWQSSGKFTSNLTASALSVLLMAASQQVHSILQHALAI